MEQNPYFEVNSQIGSQLLFVISANLLQCSLWKPYRCVYY